MRDPTDFTQQDATTKADQLAAYFQDRLHEPVLDASGKPMLDRNGQPMTHLDYMWRAMIKDGRHYTEILTRAYGKPKQPLEHTGPDGGPIQTVIKFIDDSKDADNINQEEL